MESDDAQATVDELQGLAERACAYVLEEGAEQVVGLHERRGGHALHLDDGDAKLVHRWHEVGEGELAARGEVLQVGHAYCLLDLIRYRWSAEDAHGRDHIPYEPEHEAEPPREEPVHYRLFP